MISFTSLASWIFLFSEGNTPGTILCQVPRLIDVWLMTLLKQNGLLFLSQPFSEDYLIKIPSYFISEMEIDWGPQPFHSLDVWWDHDLFLTFL